MKEEGIQVYKPDRIAHVHAITFFDCYACKGLVPQNTWGAHLLWKCHIEGKKKQQETNTTWKYKRLIENTNFVKWWILMLWWTNHDKIDIRNLFYQGFNFSSRHLRVRFNFITLNWERRRVMKLIEFSMDNWVDFLLERLMVYLLYFVMGYSMERLLRRNVV